MSRGASEPHEQPLLDVHDLRVSLPTARGPVDALRGIDLSIGRAQTVGLIGESGCGKSLTALALMRLLPERARLTGSIRFDGRELAHADEAALYATAAPFVRPGPSVRLAILLLAERLCCRSLRGRCQRPGTGKFDPPAGAGGGAARRVGCGQSGG